MGEIQNQVVTQHLQMNEIEKKLLAAEEEKYGEKLVEMSKDQKYGMCFACGEQNPIGLHLHFFWIPNGVLAFFTPRQEHQSYDGRMHGGLIRACIYGTHRPAFPHAGNDWQYHTLRRARSKTKRSSGNHGRCYNQSGRDRSSGGHQYADDGKIDKDGA